MYDADLKVVYLVPNKAITVLQQHYMRLLHVEHYTHCMLQNVFLYYVVMYVIDTVEVFSIWNSQFVL